MGEPTNPTHQTHDVSADDASALAAESLLKLILDEERLAILGLTAQRPYTVRELVEALPGKRTPPAKHVMQLVEAGVLTPVGAESYALNVRQLQQWKRELFARATPPTPQSSDEQILANFVRGGKMVQYPVQYSKRLVVLRWLASHFESGRTYAEREVNEILAGHSEDHATLRRYLVDAQLLVRQAGIYQRTQA
jgi:hypothetical protein